MSGREVVFVVARADDGTMVAPGEYLEGVVTRR